MVDRNIVNKLGLSREELDQQVSKMYGEEENEFIPTVDLYLGSTTGIAIDIGLWTPGGYSFRYVRFTDAGGIDTAQIDAVERLN